MYRHSLNILGSQVSVAIQPNEFRISEKIKKKLLKENRKQDALSFSDMFRRLSSKNFLQKKWSILYFLYVVSTDSSGSMCSPQGSLLLDTLSVSGTSGPPSMYRPSAIGARSSSDHGGQLPRQPVGVESIGSSHNLTGTSGIGSMGTSVHSAGSFAQPYGKHDPSSSTPRGMDLTTPTPREAWTTSQPYSSQLDSTLLPREGEYSKGDHKMAATTSVNPLMRPLEPTDNTSYEVSEALLVRDLIFVFQGIDGKYIHYSKSEDGYRVDPKVGVPRSVREECHKLGELGWLFRKVRSFTENKKLEKTAGLVVNSFCHALSVELNEYYCLVAALEAQQPLSEGVRGDLSVSLSLHRLIVWTYGPLQVMKLLAILCDKSRGLKGGTLLSMLYSFTHHGDPSVQALVKQLLTQAYRPVNFMLSKWMFEGLLEDNFHEFFISSDPATSPDKMWHSKYAIRTTMLPTFISMETAERILIIGKSINFLRQRCHNRTAIGEAIAVRWITAEGGGNSIFDSMTGPQLQKVIDQMYKETSKYLLEVFNTQYMFPDHLLSLRKYLLLRQGDFIQHLMDLLEQDLAKPAELLYVHNLTSTLEGAIRATNAQFDPSDMLKRLDVRLLDISPGDSGWDVFSLDYHVDGPISTVFTPETMLQYLRIFNFLWRAKRMEFTLARLWRDQMANFKPLQEINEFRPVLHYCHTLSAAMVHFMNQLQYYVTFEVLEFGWAKLQSEVSSATDLDQIITAHNKFLSDMTTRLLLEEASQELLTQLRAVFDLVVGLQHKQELIIPQCCEELERRKRFELRKEKRATVGQWGTTERESEEEQIRRDHFIKTNVESFKSQLDVLHKAYKRMVEEFLEKLAQQKDENLRFLAVRLDYNQHYKDKDCASV
jgi:gamma-tubulin complex component 3